MEINHDFEGKTNLKNALFIFNVRQYIIFPIVLEKIKPVCRQLYTVTVDAALICKMLQKYYLLTPKTSYIYIKKEI